MARPFMLYHWSPVVNHDSILRRGLCIKHRSINGEWRPPYICFAPTPSLAWALSATHNRHIKKWDLWCCWNDSVSGYEKLFQGDKNWPKTWPTEYRVYERIPKSRLWYVGTRNLKLRRNHVSKKT
jgi:hypothetical protein